MTTLALDPMYVPRLPRRAIACSLAAHAAALLLVPGLGGEKKEAEPLPLVVSLRLLPAVERAPATPVPAAATAGRRPAREQPAQPAQAERRAAAPPRATPTLMAPVPAPVPAVHSAPAASRSEAPPPEAPAMLTAAPARDSAARSDTAASHASLAAPAAPAPDGAALDDYGRALSELLARQQQYPRLAALRGWEGEVRVRLRVARKGSLVGVQVVRSSGHEVLDQHALQLVQAAPLPAPPDSFGDREIQVVVPIHYKLQRPT